MTLYVYFVLIIVAVEEPNARSEVEVLEVMKESLRMRDVNNRVTTACHLLTPSAVQSVSYLRYFLQGAHAGLKSP